MIASFMVAGTKSGVGKTTVTLGIIGALTQMGYKVQPFKAGPDFIDMGLHSLFTRGATQSHNLDTWILRDEVNRSLFWSKTRDCDVAIVEGVMGLFDGAPGHSERGSSAYLAKVLGIPVVLVVDCHGLARSILPVLNGFLGFDPGLCIKGVVLNRVGSESHASYLRGIIEEKLPDLCVVGAIPRDASIAIPGRHLGLVTAEDVSSDNDLVKQIVGAVTAHLNIDRLIKIASDHPVSKGYVHWMGMATEGSVTSRGGQVTIGVARDNAFSFYYQANLELLEKNGAQLVFFSPVNDGRLPRVDALYFGGGYPELYAERLSANASMLMDIRSVLEAGAPCYGECGGMMYLSQGIYHGDGTFSPMVGALPFSVRMLDAVSSLGYREVECVRSCILGPKGTKVRGHEFHYSEIVAHPAQGSNCAYETHNARGRAMGDRGIVAGNILSSYVHLHFYSNLGVARNFVDFVRLHRK